jgi:ABC-type lipoprotein release transport system permease subunit
MRAVWLRVHAGLRQDWRGPLVLALITALMGALVLVSLAGARRTDTAVSRDLAILKALGFVSRQVRATVAWQATAIAGLVIGLPLGVAAGRWGWTVLARGFAIEPVPVIPLLVLLAVPAVLVLANVVAAVPARAAARTQAAVVLRTE